MSLSLRREDCEEAVRTLLKTSKFFLKNYKTEPFSDKVVGFMGRHYKLMVTVILEGKVREHRLFAKLPPTNESHRNFMIELNYFSKEVAMYKELVPLLTHSLPDGVELPVPRCLFARCSTCKDLAPAEEDLIILEDVSPRGYRLLDNFPPLDLPHCLLVLKTMARFHAASILLEHSRKSQPMIDSPEELFAVAKESFLVRKKDHLGYKWAKSCAESLATVATKLWPKRFAGKRAELVEPLKEGWRIALTMAQKSREYKNVLCHGDMWTNNVLFRYDSDEKDPIDAIFVDLQLVRYAPPVTDILLFLHVCTRKAFRDLHLNEMLRFYHESLEEIVTPDILEGLLPLASLLESYERLKLFGIMVSTGYVPVLVLENAADIPSGNSPQEPLDIDELLLQDRGEKIATNCVKSEICRERIGETYEECLEELGLWKDETSPTV